MEKKLHLEMDEELGDGQVVTDPFQQGIIEADAFSALIRSAEAGYASARSDL